jgi:hypothetical protein
MPEEGQRQPWRTLLTSALLSLRTRIVVRLRSQAGALQRMALDYRFSLSRRSACSCGSPNDAALVRR